MPSRVQPQTVLGLPIVISLVVSLLVSLVILGLRTTGAVEVWGLKAYDWLLRSQPTEAPADHEVVLVTLSEHDIETMGHWPLSDGLLADILDRTLRYKPRVIGVDMYRDFALPPGEEALNELLRNNSNVVMVDKFGGDGSAAVRGPASLEGTDQLGFSDVLVDPDGVVRRGLLFLDDDHGPAYSFALRLAVKYLAVKGVFPESDATVPDLMRLGKTTFYPLEPHDGAYVQIDARGYQFMLDFFGSPTPPRSYSVRDLLSEEIPSASIHDKIVLVGVTAESMPDLFHTPYGFGVEQGQRGMYGVQLHAHIVEQLLRAALHGSSPRRSLGGRTEIVWILCWGLLGGFIGRVTFSVWRCVVMIGGGLVLLVGSVAALFAAGWWVPLIPSGLAYLGSATLLTAAMVGIERRERSNLMRLFSRHVSPEVAETIWRERTTFWDGGRPRSQLVTVTVLFSDLEGFTPVSEKLEPSQLMEWTNGYVDAMARLVMEHGGVVDDYFGDAIKANFGVPVPRTTEAEIRQDAVNAVTCARAMSAELIRLNERWSDDALPTARMRIGIATGEVVAGTLGSAERLKYTTIGDTVNIAARLEGFQKDQRDKDMGTLSCRILVAESTVACLDAQTLLKPFGDLNLKGKVRKVGVYRLVDESESAIPPVSSSHGLDGPGGDL